MSNQKLTPRDRLVNALMEAEFDAWEREAPEPEWASILDDAVTRAQVRIVPAADPDPETGRTYALSQQTCDNIMLLTAWITAANHRKDEVLPPDQLLPLVSDIRFAMKQAWEQTIDGEIDAALQQREGGNG